MSLHDSMNPIHEDVDSDMSKGGHESQTDDRLSNSAEKAPEIGSKETRMVNYSKVLVVAVIVIVAAAIGVATFKFVSDQERDDHTKQVSADGPKMMETNEGKGSCQFDS